MRREEKGVIGAEVEAIVEAEAEVRHQENIEIKDTGNLKKLKNHINMMQMFIINNRFIKCSIRNLFLNKIIMIIKIRNNNKFDCFIYFSIIFI